MIIERPYSEEHTGEVSYFIGNEVEHTPAYGMKTLFVVGVREIDETLRLAKEHDIEHIFLGANQSYNPRTDDDQLLEWDIFTTEVTRKFKGYVTLDFNIDSIQGVYEYRCCEYHNFIPLISIKVPHVNLLNYNACVKIDDIGFNDTNPGVWVQQVRDLLDSNKFTPWMKYKNDKIIQGDKNVREDE